ncbi:MAG: hypothetical protein DRP15_01430 [Candidatus Aenigmatarchaeota archaeon]|nr:MAG: hypothetical protein DRP15_01430 [Candidatus Aenigmarchaeota archaeon]
MKSKKPLDVKTLVSALIISAILFGAGLFTGFLINKERLSGIEKEMKNVITDVENFQLQFLFFDVLGENATCPLLKATLLDINKNSYEIGSKLTSYGSDSEIHDYNEYINLKKEYSRLLISYWLLANKLRTVCNYNASTIVYFFSKDCARCDDQGFILTYLKSKFSDNILIFALDADLDEPSVQVLKKYYNITTTTEPALVINGKLYQKFCTEEELEKILNLNK